MIGTRVGKSGIFERHGFRLSDDQYADLAEWARGCRTFSVGGLAQQIEAQGIPRQIDLRHGPALIALPMAQHMVGFWARTGCIRLAGTRLYRWAP